MVYTRFGSIIEVRGFDPDAREVLGLYIFESGSKAPLKRWPLDELAADGGLHEIFAQASSAMYVMQRCRACGCTDERACEGGCFWVDWDLCSVCSGQGSARYIDATKHGF